MEIVDRKTQNFKSIYIRKLQLSATKQTLIKGLNTGFEFHPLNCKAQLSIKSTHKPLTALSTFN